MRTFYQRHHSALLVAISLGSGVLLVAAVGVCVGGGGSDIKIGVVVGIIGALVFSVWVFVIVFKSLDKSRTQTASRASYPLPPHYYRNRAQQRESNNNENQE